MESKKLAIISLILALLPVIFSFGLNLFYNSIHPYPSLTLDYIFGFGSIVLALFAVIFGVISISRVKREGSSQKALIVILSFLSILIGLYITLINLHYYMKISIWILQLTGNLN